MEKGEITLIPPYYFYCRRDGISAIPFLLPLLFLTE